MRFKLGLGLAAICAVAFAMPAWAHHSHGNYVDTFMDIQGVVKEVHLVVPAFLGLPRSQERQGRRRKSGLSKRPAGLASRGWE